MSLEAALIVDSRKVLVAVEDGQFDMPSHVVFSNGIEIYLADGCHVYAKDNVTGQWLAPNKSEKFRIYFYPKGWWLLHHLANRTIERMISAGLLTLNQDQPLLRKLLDGFIQDITEEVMYGPEDDCADVQLEECALESARRLDVILERAASGTTLVHGTQILDFQTIFVQNEQMLRVPRISAIDRPVHFELAKFLYMCYTPNMGTGLSGELEADFSSHFENLKT
jgi:hypothetical protein